jgi:hypothetical protein
VDSEKEEEKTEEGSEKNIAETVRAYSKKESRDINFKTETERKRSQSIDRELRQKEFETKR